MDATLRGRQQQRHADPAGGCAEIAVLGRERQAAPHGELQIARVIGAQALFLRQIEDAIQGQARSLFIDDDRQAIDEGDEFAGARRRDAPFSPSNLWPLLNSFSRPMVSRSRCEPPGFTGTSRAIGVP